ncbi:MAG TPA: beta-hydroxyacyl-ACP dehydratase [Candidatus Dormibacteraeota bacterium]|jgi:3-hydroxyacyl-[acyl-carrier-protein] dehydratase|nr:beta-hydroxyacyl-ACP dehydratase [Candidatus Dormibacteraeota bacterium]
MNRSGSQVASPETQCTISPLDVMGMLPRGLAFCFLDEIEEIDATHVVASYRFREDEMFYPGHFPEKAVTPGTILLEAMCQCGIAAQSYFLLAQELSIEKAKDYRILFTGAQVEWFEQVGPGTKITLHGELLAWRRRRIRAHVKIFDQEHRLIAEASELAGMGVLFDQKA